VHHQEFKMASQINSQAIQDSHNKVNLVDSNNLEDNNLEDNNNSEEDFQEMEDSQIKAMEVINNE